jgi:hypothetical protein
MKKTICLFFLIIIVFSCDKNAQNSSGSDSEDTDISAEENRAVKVEEILLNEYRWIDAPDGMRMRDQPDSSGNTVTVVPSFSKVLLINETGEEITLQNHTGRWSYIEWDGRKGYIFGGYLSREEIKPKANNIMVYEKYEFIDDPYNEQYIIFYDDSTCIINKNMCEGFYEKDYYYSIEGDRIKIYWDLAEEYIFELIIISERELEFIEGTSGITCGNLEDPAVLRISGN